MDRVYLQFRPQNMLNASTILSKAMSSPHSRILDILLELITPYNSGSESLTYI